jgi:YVTN family beta-propeller protein
MTTRGLLLREMTGLITGEGTEPLRAKTAVVVIAVMITVMTAIIVLVFTLSPLSVTSHAIVYVAKNDNTISVIDAFANQVVATIFVGRYPWEMSITPDGMKIYVSTDTVWVIDTVTYHLVALISVDDPGPVVFAHNGTRAYVSCGYQVSVIDTVINKVIATLPMEMAKYPKPVAITPDETRAYAANDWSSTVSIIDMETNNITSIIPVGNRPFEIAITLNGTRAYIVDIGNANVLVMDTATNQVIDTIHVQSLHGSMAITPDGTQIYVFVYINTISVIDTAINKVIGTILVGHGCEKIVIASDGIYAYVGCDDTITVINIKMNTVVATIPVERYFVDMVITPDGLRVYAAFAVYDADDKSTTTIFVIDTATNQVIDTLSMEAGPLKIATRCSDRCRKN